MEGFRFSDLLCCRRDRSVAKGAGSSSSTRTNPKEVKAESSDRIIPEEAESSSVTLPKEAKSGSGARIIPQEAESNWVSPSTWMSQSPPQPQCCVDCGAPVK
jgi:hypothetical protein